MALVEGELLPKVTIDLSTRKFTSDWVTTVFKGEISWRLLLLLATKPLEKILKEEISKVCQAHGRDFVYTHIPINNLRRSIDPDNGRPLIATIRGSRFRGREVLGYSFLADVNLIGQEQPDPPKKAESMFLPSMDAEEFSGLYEKQINHTTQYIDRRVGNYHDAEDLAHEVYLRAWRANVRGYYQQADRAVPWIHQITHNKLVDHYKTKKQTTFLEGMDIPASETSDPAILAERQFENDRLHWAISKLKRNQQIVVRARYIDEMEFSDIAKMIGSKSQVTVRVILHRAILKLRELLPEDLRYNFRPE